MINKRDKRKLKRGNENAQSSFLDQFMYRGPKNKKSQNKPDFGQTMPDFRGNKENLIDIDIGGEPKQRKRNNSQDGNLTKLT